VLAEEGFGAPHDATSVAHAIGQALGSGEAQQAQVLPLVRGAGTAGDEARAAAFDLLAVPRPFGVVAVEAGGDGRIGSLIPGTDGLAQLLAPETPATVAAVDVPAEATPRLTLTLSALVAADAILILGEGSAVRSALHRAMDGAPTPAGSLLRRAPVPPEFHLCPRDPA
jgi:6-phosphogluconolactonase/glucosamine-6-phosphate isomerase/deaminase